MLFQELDYQYGVIREEIHVVRVQRDENNKQMEENNQQMEQLWIENETLIEMNARRDADNKKLSEDLDEALTCLWKLEEVRYTMNRLMGPKGVLEDHERYKLLITWGEYDDEVKQKQQQETQLEAGNASKKMQNANNDYFYGDTRGGKAAKAP